MKPRILIADDDENILKLLEMCLVDYDITSARNGQEAIDLWQADKYDLIILDLMMPKLNGWEVCKKIRKKSTATPILILTAKETTEDLFEGGRPDGFLIKPFDPVELVKKINSMLGGR